MANPKITINRYCLLFLIGLIFIACQKSDEKYKIGLKFKQIGENKPELAEVIHFDSLGRINQEVYYNDKSQIINSVSHYEYDSSDNLTFHTNFRGDYSKFVYKNQLLISKETEFGFSSGHAMRSYFYGEKGKIHLERNTFRNKIFFSYDKNDSLIAKNSVGYFFENKAKKYFELDTFIYEKNKNIILNLKKGAIYPEKASVKTFSFGKLVKEENYVWSNLMLKLENLSLYFYKPNGELEKIYNVDFAVFGYCDIGNETKFNVTVFDKVNDWRSFEINKYKFIEKDFKELQTLANDYPRIFNYYKYLKK
jgi:hypothetical protein